ncbi:MAG: hypothetical protein WEA09_13265 [Gemmatimonadota bacterium]
MNRRRAISTALFVLSLAACTHAAQAQNITLKTLPIPTGEQFLLSPSQTMGMGSTGIAFDDAEGRPFSNPALWLRGGDPIRLFVAPTFYGETNQWVGGRTLPMSGLFTGNRVHGGFALAVQQVQNRGALWGWPVVDAGGRSIREDPANNYLFATVGARLTDRFSAGVSIFQASLGAVDGVNMLYGRARSIEQDGTLSEVRLGFAGDLGQGRALEGTVTTTRVDIVHDVGYVEWIWESAPGHAPPVMREWDERNEDYTVSWGTRLRYTHPVGEVSRLGVILAATTKDHPKIPNYNVVDIPRDPGNSAVFNLGVGASQSENGSTLSMEVIFEPGQSHTWAFADTTIALPSGATLQAGDRTVDNQFRFKNWNVGVGFQKELDRTAWQMGLRVRQVNYTLDQHNYLAEEQRDTRESWMEWTPSWGALLKLGGMELRYAGRFTTKGWPDTVWFGVTRADFAQAGPGVDFVVGPTGPVNIPAFRVTTHRITASIPFGR